MQDPGGKREISAGGIRWLLLSGFDVATQVPPALQQMLRVFVLALPEQEEILRAIDSAIDLFGGSLDVDEKAALAAALQGNPLEEVSLILRQAVQQFGCVDARAIALAKCERIRRLQYTSAEIMHPRNQEVAGLEVLQEWISKNLVPSFALAAKGDSGAPTRRGLLLVGPPGTGKSVVAERIVEQLGVVGISLDIGSVMGSLLGSSEGALRQVLLTAENLAPCILFIDEIDKAGLDGASTDGGTSKRMLGTLLKFLSTPRAKPVFVVATMNNLGNGIPAEFTRAGRFDAIFFVDLPNTSERAAILAVHAKKYRNVLSTQDYQDLAKETRGFSGAELQALIECAWYANFDSLTPDRKTPEAVLISRKNLDQALFPGGKKVIPQSVSRKDYFENIRKAAVHIPSASCREVEAESDLGVGVDHII